MTPSPHCSRHRGVVAALLFSAAITLYLTTLAPSIVALFDDSMEFQLVCYQLGIAHPTGYPLFTLLGWLFTRLPVGDVAYRVNLMSAFFGGVTVTVAYLAGLELAGRQDRQRACPEWSVEAGSILGAIALAVSPVFWSQATVAEVYTLNSALVALQLWALLRLANGLHQPEEAGDQLVRNGSGSGRCAALRKQLLIIAFLFGLGLAHHRTMLLLLPAAAIALWCVRRALSAGPEVIAALAAPLLLYLYLPLRGHVGSLDGTYINTVDGFLRHVTASGYGTFFLQNPLSVERGVTFYLDLFVRQFGWLGIASALLGLVTLSRPKGAPWVTQVAFVSFGVFNLFYRVADIEVFFIPMFLIWTLWLGRGAGWLLACVGSESIGEARGSWAAPAPRRTAGYVVSAVIVVALAGQCALRLQQNLPQGDRSQDWVVHDYGLDIMNQPLTPGAAIVGIQGEITLIRYFQLTQGLRTDLLPIAVDRPGKRLDAVTHLLDHGYAVYITREMAGAPERWSLGAVGPLVRVFPQPEIVVPETSNMLNAILIPEIALYGYSITRPPSHQALPPLRVNLVWHALDRVSNDLKVSARLLASDGQQVAQADAVPVHFTYPTTAWRAGEFIADVYDLSLPKTLPEGQYVPLVILYDPAQEGAEAGRLALPPVYLP
jgi:hypothetical protein